MNAKLWFVKALKLFQFIYQKTPPAMSNFMYVVKLWFYFL